MSDQDDVWRTISNLRKRVEQLEAAAQVPGYVYEFLRRLCACDGCGIVFHDADYRGKHICHGRQGR